MPRVPWNKSFDSLLVKLFPDKRLHVEPSRMCHRRSQGTDAVHFATEIPPGAIHAVVQVRVQVVHPRLGHGVAELGRVEDGHEALRRVEATPDGLLLEHDVLLDERVAPALRSHRVAPLALEPQRDGEVLVAHNAGLVLRHELIDVPAEEDIAGKVLCREDESQAEHSRLGGHVKLRGE